MYIRRDKESLRTAYLLDRLLGKQKNTKHGLYGEDIHRMREIANELGNREDEFGLKLVSCDYDWSLWKIFVPGDYFTEEEEKETRDEMWIHAYPSQYDCTGQDFTLWIKFFKVPGGTWVYHRVGRDV